MYFEDLCGDLHFAEMKDTIHSSLENKEYGHRFPLLLKTAQGDVVFSAEHIDALEKEILTIIDEKKKLIIVPQYSVSMDSISTIIRILKKILIGCREAREKRYHTYWFPDMFDENKALAIIEGSVNHLKGKVDSVDIHRIPPDDKKTFHLISSADTRGVYLLDNDVMRILIEATSINSLMDLTAILEIYGLGLLENGITDGFIKNGNSESKSHYSRVLFEKILGGTQGLNLYSEQINDILQITERLPLERVEIFRRSMARRDVIKEEMQGRRDDFISGAVKKGSTKKVAERTFDLMYYLAEYGASESFLTKHATYMYQTAYLKAHYPEAFEASVFCVNRLLFHEEKLEGGSNV